MSDSLNNQVAITHDATAPEDFAHKLRGAESVASTETTDAINTGIVHGADHTKSVMKRGTKGASEQRTAKAAKASAADKADVAEDAAATKTDLQRRHHLRAGLTDEAVAQLDQSDELSGVQGMYQGSRSAASAGRRIVARTSASKAAKSSTHVATETSKKTSARKTSKLAEARRRMQSRRTWLAARQAQAESAKATAATAAKRGGIKTVAAALSSALAPLSGVLTGVLCFVLCVLLISQMVSALFGFWENEASKNNLAGLPVYVTAEMVEAALECQETYGHPAGCTLAQIICESGQGDHLSGLATRDYNLFGVKWASSFASCSEVDGKEAWATNEEYGGEIVTIMADFTKFKSYKDCITFRSRVLLQASRYADNDLIREAIATKSSDKMAEGLKAAGYATSSTYVDSLKKAMSTYNLYRFDGMTLEQYRAGSASGSAVIDAAMSQLGVPYVWGGTSPGVGLDCSGLTQYCYKSAGVLIPRNSEDQHAGGTSVPLTDAKPGDILWKPGHVAIFLGGDSYIHEPQPGDVCKISTGISYFTCAVRY